MGKNFSSRERVIFTQLNYLGYSQKKIADLIGVSQATVSRMLREERDKRTKKEEERCQGKNSR